MWNFLILYYLYNELFLILKKLFYRADCPCNGIDEQVVGGIAYNSVKGLGKV